MTPADVSTTQIITRVRAPTADDVTAADSSVTRLLQLVRVPSSDTITVADSSLTRILSSARFNADRVTVGEGAYTLRIHIPLYIYPTHWIPASEWYQLSDLIAANPNVEFILKLNVNSGPDTAVNTDYEAGINILQDQGNISHIKLIGYVFTSFGSRAMADVKLDIDRWQSFYGSDINGIFLDEMESIAGEEAYYRELTNYIHSKGMEISWGNPGTEIDESYIQLRFG